MSDLARQAAYEIADIYETREELRWFLADRVALADGELLQLREELEEQHGIRLSLQTLRNYARVAKSFAKINRHYQYKWANYLEWSKWENPIKALEIALDNGYSPQQMARLRIHGDPNHRKPRVEECDVCGGDLGRCQHGERR